MVLLLHERKDTYEMGLLDLRNDFVFKAFFGDRRNNNLLLDFLNAILDENIVSVKLTDPYTELSHADDKASEMDIRILTDTGEQINVEMQLRGHRAFNERMLIYWAKMYGNQDKGGKSYRELTKAIQIAILDFILLPKKHFHSKFQLVDLEVGTVFSPHAEIHTLELPKFKSAQIRKTNKLEKWVLFLQGDKQIKEALAMESPTMKEAFEEIQRLSQDPQTRARAISREIHLRDQLQREEDAKIDGMEQGIAKREREIVLKMHTKQVPSEIISDLTGIPLEQVKKIIKSNLQ